jgi:hypothetical protein
VFHSLWNWSFKSTANKKGKFPHGASIICVKYKIASGGAWQMSFDKSGAWERRMKNHRFQVGFSAKGTKTAKTDGVIPSGFFVALCSDSISRNFVAV